MPMFLWVLGMLLAQAITTGMGVLYKISYHDYTCSMRVLVVYRFAIATGCMLPLAWTERGTRPPLTRRILVLGVFSGLIGGALGQNLFVQSYSVASTTYVAAIFNITPVITYILALLFRMEPFSVATWPQKAKVFGTIISIGGAMVITFYLGPKIHWSTSLDLLNHNPQGYQPPEPKPILGMGLASSSSFCFAMLLILLTRLATSEGYPVVSSMFLMCSSSLVGCTIYTLIVDPWHAWLLAFDFTAITVIYSGIFASVVSVILVTYCTRELGPVFVSVFSPFSLIFTALMSPLLLHELLRVGSILGGAIIIIGVYITVWGKRLEIQQKREDEANVRRS